MRRSLQSALIALELVTLAVVLVCFLGVFVILRQEVVSRYYRRLEADLSAAESIATAAIQGYAESFTALAEHPDADPALLISFGDIYEVDGRHRIVHIRKRRAGSAVFPGFDLSQGPVGRFLAEPGTGVRISPILRAPEDERPSLYAAAGLPNRMLLGRVVLDTLIRDLSHLAARSGTLIGIADSEGFLLVGSAPQLPSPLPQGAHRIVKLDDIEYLYATRSAAGLGVTFAVFEPAAGLASIIAPVNRALLLLLGAFVLLLGIKVTFAVRRVLGPIQRFSLALEAWSSGSPEPAPAQGISGFAEVEALYRAFEAKAAEIRRINEGLEAAVIERTAELSRANEELAASNAELATSKAELERTQDLLVLSEKMALLGRLAAGIAHDLNTPLAAISSAAVSIQENIARMLPEHGEAIRGITGRELGLIIGIVSRALAQEGRPLVAAGAAARKARAALAEAFRAAGSRLGLAESALPDPDSAADDLVDAGILSIEAPDLEALLSSGRASQLVGIMTSLAGVLSATRIIRAVSERASHIVLGLKTWSYTEGDQPGLLELRSEFESILSLYSSRLSRGVSLETDFQDPGLVIGSAVRLGRVWVNLIDNALDAMGGAGCLKVGIRRIQSPGGDSIEVETRDTGPGIAPEFLGRIFEPGFTTKSRGRGSGLGLDLCKRLVELHGGRIHFTTGPEGTAFIVELKAASPVAIRPDPLDSSDDYKEDSYE